MTPTTGAPASSPCLHRLLDALVDGGPEALRDHAADDLVDELVALVARRAARARCRSRRTGRDRRSASCSGAAPATPCGSSRGRGRAAGAGRPRRRTVASGGRRRPRRASGSSRREAARRSARPGAGRASGPPRRGAAATVATLSSSPFAFGVTAKLITGCGKTIGSTSTGRSLDREHVTGLRLLELRDGADVARCRTPEPAGAPCPGARAAGRGAPCRAVRGLTSVESALSRARERRGRR